MADPLGRKHTTLHKPRNRHQVDRCADYVMDKEKKSFLKKPSSSHIYFDAYALMFGVDTAHDMLFEARKK